MNRYILIILSIIFIGYVVLQMYANNIEIHIFDSNKPGINLFIIGGTHGNEPAGSVALTNLINQIKQKEIIIIKGKITIINKPNKLGLIFNSRYLLHRFYNRDLNRNYPRNSSEYPLDPISKKIINIIHNSDWILDFHEGWGYLNEQQGSMGSGIFPGITKKSISMAKNMITVTNSLIQDDIKKFGLMEGINPDIRSLKNYCDYIEKNYILIETSGQNDIQELSIRVDQVKNIIEFFLKYNDMIYI